nr:retrotransposon protein, putative, Ty1-copia subclass [Tanacetum cinerariifolium]
MPDGLQDLFHSVGFETDKKGKCGIESLVVTRALKFESALEFNEKLDFDMKVKMGLSGIETIDVRDDEFGGFDLNIDRFEFMNMLPCTPRPMLALQARKLEKPIPPAHAADSAANVLAEWNAVYDAHNEVACLMLGSMTPGLHRQFKNSSPYEMLQELKSMFEKQAGVDRFDLIQTFHACKQDEGKSVSQYVLKMKGYVEQLEHFGYVLQQDLSVGLILNGLTSDFAGFVRNYNMHNMEKTIGELHAVLIEYEKGLPKKAATPQVIVIHGDRIQKTNKKSKNAKGKGKGKGKGKDKSYVLKPKNPKPNAKEHLEKNDACHHCKEGIRGGKKLKQSNGIYEIDMSNYVPNVNSIYNVSNIRVKHNLDSTYLWHCRLAHISKKRIRKLQHDGLLKSTDDESFDQCVSCLSGKMTRKSFPHRPKRATDLFGLIHTDVCGPLRHVSRQGVSYFITFTDDYSRYGYIYLHKNKHEVFETFKLTPPYTPQHNEVSERRNRTLLDMVRSMMNLTTSPLSFWDYALESAARILNMVPTKKVDKTPYELWFGKVPNLSYLTVWGCEALVKRDTPDKLQQRSVKCIFIGYPKKTMGYYFYFLLENKIVVARYAEFFEKNLLSQEVSGRAGDLTEIQDEDTSPFKITSEIPIEMQSMKDNQVWRLVDLPPNETFSPVADIRAIRILIAIVAFYDYEIWKMDVKTAFINGYLDEDIYMVQPESFIDPKHPRKLCKLQRSIYGLKQASRS